MHCQMVKNSLADSGAMNLLSVNLGQGLGNLNPLHKNPLK